MSASALWDGTQPGGVGGPARSRTGNQAVMSRRLYLLSYRPICNISSIFLSIDLPRP